MKSDITVVIGSYGYGYLIAQAIDSVLAQTRKPANILVVDDGANDRACDVAEKYGINFIKREKNLGVVDNYNDILFNHVKTSKMMILAADDYLRPDYLEKMDLDYDIVSSDIILCGPDSHRIMKGKRTEFKDGYWIWRFKPTHISRKNYIHGSSIYNVELAKKVGGYVAARDRVQRKEEDWGLWRRMIGNGATHYHIAEPLLYYRKHKFNLNGVY